MKTRNRIMVLILTTLAIAVIAAWIGVNSGSVSAQEEAKARWTPFVADVHTTDISPNGTVTLDRSLTIAVRSDGSHAELIVRNNNSPDGKKSIVDLKSNKRILVDPATGSTTTYPLSPYYAIEMQKKLACKLPEGAAVDKILGYEVYQSKRTQDNKEAKLHLDEWIAPALNCHFLRSVGELVYADGRPLGRKTQEVTRIVAGEPSNEFFEIPADYTERSPSEVLRESDRRGKTGAQCASCNDRTNQHLDAVYRSANAPQ